MRAQMHANIDGNVEAKPLTLNAGLVPVASFGTSTTALYVTRCLYFSTICGYIVCSMYALAPIGPPWYPPLPSTRDVDGR